MKIRSDIFNKSVDHFSTLYGSAQTTIRRILLGIDLDDNNIDYKGSAKDVWSNVIIYIDHNEKFEELIEFIYKEYNNSITNFIISELKNGNVFKKESYIPISSSYNTLSNYFNCICIVSNYNSIIKANGCFISNKQILIAFHAIFDDSQNMIVTMDGLGSFEAKVLKKFPEFDFAILETDGFENSIFFKISLESPSLPEVSSIIGYDFNYLKPILLNGTYKYSDELHYYYYFPYLPKGLSGSPLINEKNEIIGLLRMSKPDKLNKQRLVGFIKSNLIKEKI
jgi:hypothetical protein